MSEPASIVVHLADRCATPTVDASRWAQLLSEALDLEGASTPSSAGLTFVDEDEMAGLNQQHMGGTGPTDVLAFPIDGCEPGSEGVPALIGDVVICPTYAGRAVSDGRTLADEVALLVVHGSLHLLGHDHGTRDEALTMASREEAVLRALYDPAATSGVTVPPESLL